MTRVTLVSRNAIAIANNDANLNRASRLQEDLSSGKRVRLMSDDPVAARRALALRVDQFHGQTYMDNIDNSDAFLTASATSLGQMSEVLAGVKRIAVEGANGTLDAASRGALADSLEAHLEQMIDLANSQHGGRYLFSGTEVLTRPFALSADGSRVDYGGDLDDFAVAISPTEQAVVNENGHRLFKQDVDVFQVLIDLRDALRADDPVTVGDLIEGIDATQRHVGSLEGRLGGRQQRLELSRAVLERFDVQLGDLISREVDTDLSTTIMRLQASQVALEAGLQSSARLLQTSLLDFL